MISVSWRLSCNVFSGILGDSVDLVQTGNGVTSLVTEHGQVAGGFWSLFQEVVDVNKLWAALPPFIIVYPPGPGSWCLRRRRSRGPYSRVLSHYHTHGPLPPAHVTTLDSTARAWVRCHEPGARVTATPRVPCLGSNPGSKAWKFDDGSGGSIG